MDDNKVAGEIDMLEGKNIIQRDNNRLDDRDNKKDFSVFQATLASKRKPRSNWACCFMGQATQ